MGQSETPPTLITDAIVKKAMVAHYGMPNHPGVEKRLDFAQMRAALEAVQGDIIEEFGASGYEPKHLELDPESYRGGGLMGRR